MTPDVFLEPFVDAARAAEFLCIRPRWLMELARAGKIPAHPLGDGNHRIWRFRLSELAQSIGNKLAASGTNPRYGLGTKAVRGTVD